MTRDLSSIDRDLADNQNSDIIYKKSKLMKMFKDDPDLLEVLGELEEKEIRKNMTEAEKEEVRQYNERIKHDRIVPYLKLNGVQTEVVNYIAYDIRDSELYRYNDSIKKQELWVMCLVHEDDIDTEYLTKDGLAIPRTDLLAYIVDDLLNHTNALGMKLTLMADIPDIVDQRYYVRTLKYEIKAPNNLQGGGNKYDRFSKI